MARITRRETALLLGALTVAGRAGAAEGKPGGAISVATAGEPPTLDPMESPADVVGLISQHVFETLYTWGEGWRIVPLLAAAMPEISADGRTYTIPLRTGVAFHDGTTMTSADVLTSLDRWMRIAQRGQQTRENVDAVTAPDDHTIRIALKRPFAPLLSLLSLQTSAAIVIPRANQQQPMTEFVGTGPYRFVARMPDRYLQLRRFDQYAARTDAPNGYGGHRTPLVDEIRFVPVPNAATRVEGALAGQFDYADALPVELLARLKTGPVEPIMFPAFGWPLFFVNHKQGPLTDPALRRAVLASMSFQDMLTAAFGPGFYALDGAYYPDGFALHSEAGTEAYKQAGDTARAKRMAAEAGYHGENIRILVSQQYDFHYKLAVVAANFMKEAGFATELVVVDWATLLTQRNDPSQWELFVVHGPILPEPTLYSFMTPTAPGWWSTPARDAAVNAFNAEPDAAKRAKLWGDVQSLIYSEVPIIRAGNFNALGVRSRRLKGVTPAAWPFFWNCWLEA